jgi:hypothetical protein
MFVNFFITYSSIYLLLINAADSFHSYKSGNDKHHYLGRGDSVLVPSNSDLIPFNLFEDELRNLFA